MQENQTFPGESSDFFAFMMEESPMRMISLIICGLTLILIPMLVYTIIWFDKHGSDKRRTFINMLTSCTCWISIEFWCVIQSTEIVRYVFGPLPHWFCFAKTILRSAYITQLLFYFDAIAVVRYLFIFWLKNPSAFRDEFWYLFLNIWIKGASLIFNASWFFTAEHQIINYYLCTGKDPTEDFKKPLTLYATTEIGSLLINLVVYLRIKFYKTFEVDHPQTQSRSVTLKKLFLSEIKNRSITSFSTNLFHLTGTLLALYGSAVLSKLKPDQLKDYQGLMFLQYLVSPCLLCTSFVIAYYIRHEPLRKAVGNELRDLFLNFQENLTIIRLQISHRIFGN